mmetsp:Transcript_52457/g.139414  ORF Transcript_52457/g.139414 Transcript_52457/m.139414 type:complete len:218 (-) Transcript_52457:707-1360(-)
MRMRRCTPGLPSVCIPPSLCDASAPRDTASRCARNTELHASPTRPPVCRPVTSCCIMYPSTSKPSDPCEPICNHFHLLYRRDSSAVSFAQAWTMFWGDCHRAQTVQALRRAGAAALARPVRIGAVALRLVPRAVRVGVGESAARRNRRRRRRRQHGRLLWAWRRQPRQAARRRGGGGRGSGGEGRRRRRGGRRRRRGERGGRRRGGRWRRRGGCRRR